MPFHDLPHEADMSALQQLAKRRMEAGNLALHERRWADAVKHFTNACGNLEELAAQTDEPEDWAALEVSARRGSVAFERFADHCAACRDKALARGPH